MTLASSNPAGADASIGRGILQGLILNCILAVVVAFVCAVLMRLLPGLDLLWLPLTALVYGAVVLLVSGTFYRKHASTSSTAATASFVTSNWIGSAIGGLLTLFLLLVFNSFFDTLGIPWLGS